uniref:F-box domain-containing protein n=1 Tax=Amphora coffeiformis TaxID=265554 RepID=A0A7S3KXL9_9STRA|eukprot:scaffold1555_cov173-Amphora_coffeaeformis.AAC.26
MTEDDDKNDVMTTTTATMPVNTTAVPWEAVLCDDVLLQLLSYLDVTTAVHLLKGTSHSWRRRAADLTRRVPHLWQLWYDRCGFAPSKLVVDDNNNDNTAWNALMTSRRLSRNILGVQASSSSSPQKSKSNCFSLPNRWFSFFPVAPDDHSWWFPEDEDGNDNDDDLFLQDPPPVSFDCDSFLLTGQGTEFVLLNPFTLTVTVHQSILDQVIPSDEGMLEQAFRAASHRIVQQRGNRHSNNHTIHDNRHISRHDDENKNNNHDHNNDDDEEHLLAADAIDETLHRHHYARQDPYRVDPTQTLVNLSDTVDLNLHHYFVHPNNDRRRHQRPAAGHHFQPEEDEYELSYAGIDAKPMWKNGIYQGTMLALGRIIARISADDDEEEACCWEVLTWKKGIHDDDNSYNSAGSCRLRGTYHTLDVCPHQQVVYANPSRRVDQHDDWGADDNIFTLWAGQKHIQVIPLSTDDAVSKPTQPVAEWKCQDNVTAMIVSPAGVTTTTSRLPTIIVGTIARNLELYEPTGNTATLKQMISVSSAATAAQKRHEKLLPLQRTHPAPVTEIFCAKELPLEKAGFWTLQHNSAHGSTLLLWKPRQQEDQGATFDVETIIHLPLSSRRTPKIVYDGRRLLVYGQDHIGMILLVYHVRYSNEDMSVFDQVPVGESTSGGVVNVGHVPNTRFANRIRHVALSGMENILYEALYMTANERFVILNTKGGNLLSSGSSSPYREGLLVIDLQDEETC